MPDDGLIRSTNSNVPVMEQSSPGMEDAYNSKLCSSLPNNTSISDVWWMQGLFSKIEVCLTVMRPVEEWPFTWIIDFGVWESQKTSRKQVPDPENLHTWTRIKVFVGNTSAIHKTQWTVG